MDLGPLVILALVVGAYLTLIVLVRQRRTRLALILLGLLALGVVIGLGVLVSADDH